VRRRPYSVVLLDEIEKAHPNLFNLLLQVMDSATLTDNNGKKADFRNVILIMTTNAGARDLSSGGLGFRNASDTKGNAKGVIERTFTPEFRNRIDEIVIFTPLTKEEVREIAHLYIGKIQRTMERQGKVVEVTDAALDLLTEKGFSSAYGARFLKRHIDQKVKLPITNEWKLAMKFIVDAEDGEIVVRPGEVFSLN